MQTGRENHTHTHTPIVPGVIPLHAKLYDLYKEISNTLLAFPKAKRYTLGQRIDQLTLEILELIITAGYLPREQKQPALKKISIKLDLLKILVRLSFDTRCLTSNKYQLLSSQLLEIGKMLGGWIKSVTD